MALSNAKLESLKDKIEADALKAELNNDTPKETKVEKKPKNK